MFFHYQLYDILILCLQYYNPSLDNLEVTAPMFTTASTTIASNITTDITSNITDPLVSVIKLKNNPFESET